MKNIKNGFPSASVKQSNKTKYAMYEINLKVEINKNKLFDISNIGNTLFSALNTSCINDKNKLPAIHQNQSVSG